MKTRQQVINGINALTMVDVEIDGEKFGDMGLREVYQLLDGKYNGLEDQYNDEIRWNLVVWGEQIVVTHQIMPAALWFAHMEDYNAFRNWLRLFGWK